MNTKTFLALAGFLVLCPRVAFSGERPGRPHWDQKKAVEMVKKTTEREEKGRPWNDIAWLTDVDAAVARAQKENKPIFVYFFVKKGGPAAAPC